jgi:hypothetical protein
MEVVEVDYKPTEEEYFIISSHLTLLGETKYMVSTSDHEVLCKIMVNEEMVAVTSIRGNGSVSRCVENLLDVIFLFSSYEESEKILNIYCDKSLRVRNNALDNSAVMLTEKVVVIRNQA